MPKVGPTKRRDLVAALKRLGFTGPHYGKKHEVMQQGGVIVRIPNPHHSDISQALLLRILKEAGVSREEWEAL